MKHKFTTHTVTEINGAGVQTESWEECTVCGGVRSQYEYLDPKCSGSNVVTMPMPKNAFAEPYRLPPREKGEA